MVIHFAALSKYDVKRDGNRVCAHVHDFEGGKCACGEIETSSVISGGSLWIVIAVAAVIVAAVAALVVIKKKISLVLKP